MARTKVKNLTVLQDLDSEEAKKAAGGAARGDDTFFFEFLAKGNSGSDPDDELTYGQDISD